MALAVFLVAALFLVEVSHGKESYEETGLKYASQTQKFIGEHLMKAIQSQGLAEAVKYCNHEAMPLTEQMAEKLNAKIKRVSDKNRNSLNKANAEELKYIKKFKDAVAAGKEVKPEVILEKDLVKFYHPIMTNPMCLNCHGKTETIGKDVRAVIGKLYPNDKATGYGVNEVRGIWSIQFKKQ